MLTAEVVPADYIHPIQPGFRLLTPQAALLVKSRNLLNDHIDCAMFLDLEKGTMTRGHPLKIKKSGYPLTLTPTHTDTYPPTPTHPSTHPCSVICVRRVYI